MWLVQLGSILQNYCYLIALNQSPHMQGRRPTTSCAKEGKNSHPMRQQGGNMGLSDKALDN